MARAALFRITRPVVGLSALLTTASLVSLGHIGWQQAELARSLQADADRLQSAQVVQLRLREYRVHTVILADSPAEARRQQVSDDRRRLRAAVDSLRERLDHPADQADLLEVERSWAEYDAELRQDIDTRAGFRSSEELAEWAERHRVVNLLTPCDRLVDRAEERMAATSARSAEQTRWAGVGLLTVGVVGSRAGLMAGYSIAGAVSRRVAGLFEVYARARSGTRIEVTEAYVDAVEQYIKKKLGHDVEIVISEIGLTADWSAAFTPNAGPMDAVLKVQMTHHRERSAQQAVHLLRRGFAEDPEFQAILTATYARRIATRELPYTTPPFARGDLEFAFDAGGMIRSAMNEGKSTPLNVG